jgi:hypothetical protein
MGDTTPSYRKQERKTIKTWHSLILLVANVKREEHEGLRKQRTILLSNGFNYSGRNCLVLYLAFFASSLGLGSSLSLLQRLQSLHFLRYRSMFIRFLGLLVSKITVFGCFVSFCCWCEVGLVRCLASCEVGLVVLILGRGIPPMSAIRVLGSVASGPV